MGQAARQRAQVSGPKRAVVDLPDKRRWEASLIVECPQPGTQDRASRIGVASRADGLGKRQERLRTVSQEAEGSKRHGVDDEPGRLDAAGGFQGVRALPG